ncbi:MAG: 6-phosphofructokinase [Lachnospiraceae bacterium]|jgi:6-phosphofructokinase|nr:6-phosphofructokinase [Lachnospiraceae bacterium]MEE3461037.1 6-phosphofructokinase [Lachnospiraceae bacterium]
MKKNAMVAQSGGPTAAINASLAGVIKGVVETGCYETVYGAVHGIQGVLREDFVNLSDLTTVIYESMGRLNLLGSKYSFESDSFMEPESAIDILATTPAMYLGSCRYKLPEEESDLEIYEQIFKTLDKMNIGAFFYIGGNDSMDTVMKLSKYAEAHSIDIRFGGIPKSIDNDLPVTDHTPGFGSAAKFIATSFLEMAHDTFVYDIPTVTIVECMGRNAGWLTASSALARNKYNATPQLVYLPEVDFDKDAFLEDVNAALKDSKNVIVAVSEGIHDKDGNYISATDAHADTFGHSQLGGAAKNLEILVKNEIGVKCRSVELNILQRCAGHIASKADLDESIKLGQAAVHFAFEGNTDFIPVIKRMSNAPYWYNIELTRIENIADREKCVPTDWITPEHNNVTQEMLDYIRPLIQGEVRIAYRDGLPMYIKVPHLRMDGEN